jgi:hypothetical protein
LVDGVRGTRWRPLCRFAFGGEGRRGGPAAPILLLAGTLGLVRGAMSTAAG